MKLLVVLVLLGAAYVFGSLAIDTGRWLLYFLTVATLFAAIMIIVKFFKRDATE